MDVDVLDLFTAANLCLHCVRHYRREFSDEIPAAALADLDLLIDGIASQLADDWPGETWDFDQVYGGQNDRIVG